MQLRHCILNASSTVHLLEVLLVVGKEHLVFTATAASREFWTLVQGVVAAKGWLPLTQVHLEGGDGS